MAETSQTTQTLISSLTTSILTLSDEVNRTYGIFVIKDKDYTDILAYEAEIDRQRLEKISQNDAYNADILSSLLRDEIRPNVAIKKAERDAAYNAWQTAKTNLQNEKSKLSAAEQQLIDSGIQQQVEQNKATQIANEASKVKTFVQKNTQYLIIGGFVLVAIAVGVMLFKKMN